jgi:hypothetical protein
MQLRGCPVAHRYAGQWLLCGSTPCGPEAALWLNAMQLRGCLVAHRYAAQWLPLLLLNGSQPCGSTPCVPTPCGLRLMVRRLAAQRLVVQRTAARHGVPSWVTALRPSTVTAECSANSGVPSWVTAHRLTESQPNALHRPAAHRLAARGPVVQRLVAQRPVAYTTYGSTPCWSQQRDCALLTAAPRPLTVLPTTAAYLGLQHFDLLLTGSQPSALPKTAAYLGLQLFGLLLTGSQPSALPSAETRAKPK